MRCKIVTNWEELTKAGPGAILYTKNQSGERHLVLNCPGCGRISSLPTYGNGWTFSGSDESPTLSPSIHHIDNCGWHGYLRNGEFIEC